MEESVITLSEMLWKMNRGERFDIEFVKCDRKKGTGGGIRKMVNCIQYQTGKQRKEPQTVVVSEVNAEDAKKNPNHFDNATRNIYSFAAGEKQIRKVHIRLVTRFNGKRVL